MSALITTTETPFKMKPLGKDHVSTFSIEVDTVNQFLTIGMVKTAYVVGAVPIDNFLGNFFNLWEELRF